LEVPIVRAGETSGNGLGTCGLLETTGGRERRAGGEKAGSLGQNDAKTGSKNSGSKERTNKKSDGKKKIDSWGQRKILR